MWEDDAGVMSARWEAEAGVGLIAAMRDGVGDFASVHGMARGPREDVRTAVAEAVADAVVRIRRTEAPGRVAVAAATDGVWLSVRVHDDAGGDRENLPLVTCLPHRLERESDEAGTHVLMEFAMAATPPARTLRARRCAPVAGGRTSARRRR
jgi:hypothetical protein